ncbi:MAG: LURP-one-related/scramblase family protein [Leptolyngbyaceae cyanobacterium]
MLKRQSAKNAGLLRGGNAAPAMGRMQRAGALGAAAAVSASGLAGGDRRATLRNLREGADQRIGTRFKMKQRLFAFGDDFFITNERNEKVIKVDGKLLRLRQKLVFEDMQGREIYEIAAKIIDIRESMTIKRANGDRAAVVHNALISPIRDKWKIDIPGGDNLVAKGNILQHEYTITKRGERLPVAVISKKWFRLRDTYGVELESAFDAPLILAITVTIDMMSHDNTNNKTRGGISKGSRLDIL